MLHVLAAGSALLVGCAPLYWHKAGATGEAHDRDIADCSAEARIEARRQTPTLLPSPRIVLDNRGSTIAVQTPRDDNERFLLEHDLMRDCMRQRGYELQPRSTPNPAH